MDELTSTKITYGRSRSWRFVLGSDQLFRQVDHLLQVLLQLQEFGIVRIDGECSLHLDRDNITAV